MKATQAAALCGGLRAAMVVVALLTFVVVAHAAEAAGVQTASTAAGKSGSALSGRSASAAPTEPSRPRPSLTGVVNVNTASAEELQLLPGVGASRAAAIVAVRQSRGGFKSVDELTEVKGIGATMLDRMRPHVAVKGRTTARRMTPEASSDGS